MPEMVKIKFMPEMDRTILPRETTKMKFIVVKIMTSLMLAAERIRFMLEMAADKLV